VGKMSTKIEQEVLYGKKRLASLGTW